MRSKIANKSALLEKYRMAAQNNEGRLHIIPSYGKWKVKREGNIRASGVYLSKEEAIRHALASKYYRGIIAIHKKDGSVEVIRQKAVNGRSIKKIPAKPRKVA
ncbi:MAG TPA: DUF2188 domain-containing protein [Bacteroidetes bacterium]|nr:DUF2188 domain-containing protein [Bacteroidota bacterium]